MTSVRTIHKFNRTKFKNRMNETVTPSTFMQPFIRNGASLSRYDDRNTVAIMTMAIGDFATKFATVEFKAAN